MITYILGEVRIEYAHISSALLLILYFHETFPIINLSLLLNQGFATLLSMRNKQTKKPSSSSDNAEIKNISLHSGSLLCLLRKLLNCLYVK